MSLSVSDETTCRDAWKESEILKDRYESLQKQCKEFIEETDGVVVIDDTAILDKHVAETKKFIPGEVVSLALQKKVKLADILPFLSVTEKNAEKLFKKFGVKPSDDQFEVLYKAGKRSTFKALTKEEVEKL